ncbi:MAG: hypothetical protein ACO3T7_07790, partial [Pseudomonadales bacterium]
FVRLRNIEAAKFSAPYIDFCSYEQGRGVALQDEPSGPNGSYLARHCVADLTSPLIGFNC